MFEDFINQVIEFLARETEELNEEMKTTVFKSECRAKISELRKISQFIIEYLENCGN